MGSRKGKVFSLARKWFYGTAIVRLWMLCFLGVACFGERLCSVVAASTGNPVAVGVVSVLLGASGLEK